MATAYDAVIELEGAVCRVAVGSQSPVTWHAYTQEHLDASGAAALFSTTENEDQRVLADIKNVAQSTVAQLEAPVQSLHVLVHLPECFAVQAPLSEEATSAEAQRSLVQQAALLTGKRTAAALRLVVADVQAPLPAPADHRWYRALVVPRQTKKRVDHWGEALGVSSPSIEFSPAQTCDAPSARTNNWHIGIGCYGSRTEYAVWHGDTCAYLYYTPLAQTPSDRAYFAILLLNRLALADTPLASVWTYGPDADDQASMPPVAGIAPRLLQHADADALTAFTPNGNSHVLQWAPLHSVLQQPAA